MSVTASHLNVVGIAAGLLAAVPGAIDYRHTVPPESSARDRAMKHAIGNSTALILFAVGWFVRDEPGTTPLLTVGLEWIGAAILLYSGWLGGTLVTRNLIGVDHRYARAGKWQEVTVSGLPGQEVVVASTTQLEDGQMKLVHLNGRRVVLGKTADGYCAFEDRCTHRGGSLAGGVLIGNTVQCLWHGSQFDVTTGRVACGPATGTLRVFETRQTNDDVRLLIPGDDQRAG